MAHRDEGYAKLAAAYNDRGDLTQQEYFDLNGKPVLNKLTGEAKRDHDL